MFISHGLTWKDESSCISMRRFHAGGPRQPNFNRLTNGKLLFSPNAFLRPGELRQEGEGVGSVCVCVWGIEGGGHHVIIWHLQCPTLQICEDGEQKICLLWSPVPHSLLCGWSLWIIHREGAIGICDGKSVGEYHTIDGILHYVSCALRAHRPHIM